MIFPRLHWQGLRWRPGRIARNTAHSGFWNLIRVTLQAASLVLLTRTLGASGYGALAGSVALFMTIGQFTGLGSGVALVRHLARGGALHRRFTATVRAYFLSGVMLLALTWPLAQALLQANIAGAALACLAVTEILVAPLLAPLVYRYQADERMFVSSMVGTLAPLVRLGAILLMVVLGYDDILRFAGFYLAGMVVTVATTMVVAWPRNRHPAATEALGRHPLREGLPYAVSAAALTAGSELDKTALLRLAGEAVTGPYAAAYRIASAAMLPVNALVLAAAPRLFRLKPGDDHRLPTVMLTVVAGYAVLAAGALWALAPFVPWLLGSGFASAEDLLQWMSIMVVTGCLRQYTVALLTTRDRQANRNLIEVGGVALSLLLLILLVPGHGATGAVFALAASDAFVIGTGALALHRRDAEPDKEQHA